MADKWTENIAPLDRQRWKDHRLAFHYISYHYYDVAIRHTCAGFEVSFVKRPFDAPYEKKPDGADKLFQPWWDEVKAWGIIQNDQLLAVIETAAEDWSNRLRVTELWIANEYRRQGIGTALMNIARKRALDEKRRAIMLETQSCNENAIAFYLAQGFSLIGFDACAYSNNDLARKEVRMELGMFLA